MKQITMDMPVYEIEQLPGFRRFSRFLMECRASTWNKIRQMSIRQMQKMNIISNAESVLDGLRHVQDIIVSGIQVDREIWSLEEKEEQQDRENTRLFYLPSRPGSPFVLICPGGGYQSVCTFFEGFPAAAELNRAGYNVFILSYRVRQENLMPKPIEDVVQALSHIHENADLYQVDKRYVLMGFSAGGHLAAEMITSNFGCLHYKIPMPEALVLCYAAIDLRYMGHHETAEKFIKTITGGVPEHTVNTILEEYCINLHISPDCPPVYFWQCEDDDIVPLENYKHLERVLKEMRIPYNSVSYPNGGHGLIKPHDSFVDCWLEDVICFIQNICK